MNLSIKYSLKEFIFDLVKLLKPYRRKFLLGAFFRLISDIARLYPAFALSVIIPLLGKIHEGSSLNTITILLIVWFFATLIESLGHDFGKYLGYQSAQGAGYSLYKKCLSHVLSLDLSWHELEGSGNKMKRIDKGYEGVTESVRRVFDVLIEVTVNIIGVSIIFFTLDKTLSLATTFFVITYFIIGRYLLKKAIAQELIVNPKVEELSGLTFESLNNILTIKSLGFNKGIVKVVATHIKDLLEEIRKRIFYYRFQSGVLGLYFYLFELSILIFIVYQIWLGNYTVGVLILFFGLFDKIGTSTDELISAVQEMVVNKIWVGRAMNILRTTPKIEHPQNFSLQLAYPADWKTLKITNVHFAYKKGSALSDVTFQVNRGESIGIVGLSGSGKSTLFKLLLDLYEDYEGEIYLDDFSLKKISRESYIPHVSIVLQDTELFNMSLKDNITIANLKSDITISLKEAISMAHLEDVVKNLSDGVDTVVGEKGIKLSGGQRQRVGIARALYRQPDILLLDEATSHLDAHSERQIQLAIADVKGKFTTIVIAHRLSTIQQMDKIIVLEKGKVKEIGTFNELLALNGSFSRMWKMQKL